MKYLSLFSGIGGFELGIQQAYEQKLRNNNGALSGRDKKTPSDSPNTITGNGNGWRNNSTCIGYSEIDKYSIQTYQKHFNHKNYGDITKINEKELPDFDLLVGGFPCQSFSIAGNRGGFNDTRGTLFFEIARIVKQKQPRLLLLENVKGLLSHDKGQTFYTIISTLDELGYDCQWQVLNSKNFGVPQNRERVFIVGHLRGTPRPEVFPIGGGTKKDIVQLNHPTHSNNRLYGIEGISPTLNTAQGGNRQPKIVKVSGDLDKRKTYLGDIASTLAANPTSDNTARLFENNKIRRLTPKECERLQGFPEVEKCDILEVCKENQKKNVNAENQNHKLQKLVGSVERKDSQENAKYVVKFLNTKNQQINKLVQRNVLINCEESGIEIYSQGKLLLNAKNAEKKNWCHQYIKIEDFVQMLVGINLILEKITVNGEVESPQNEQCLALQKNGKKLEKKFGNEIMQPVGDVEKDLIILKELLKSITLYHLGIGNLEQKLATLSSFVIRAIIGYIPIEIKNQNTFTIIIKSKVGWTYGCSDSQRYRQCGNAVTVNVIQAIMERLLY